MSGLVAAIGRQAVADYVAALFLVYFALIFIRILLSWAQAFRALPHNRALRAVVCFVEETTDPYLNVFRRFIPPIGGRLDISPILAILVLFLIEALVVGAIRG